MIIFINNFNNYILTSYIEKYKPDNTDDNLLTYLKTGHKMSEDIKDLKDKINKVTSEAETIWDNIEREQGSGTLEGRVKGVDMIIGQTDSIKKYNNYITKKNNLYKDLNILMQKWSNQENTGWAEIRSKIENRETILPENITIFDHILKNNYEETINEEEE